MAWLALFRKIFGDPLAIAVGLFALAAGYFYGHVRGGIEAAKEYEQKQDKATVAAYEEVKPIELKAATDLSKIGGSYVKETEANKANSDSKLGAFVGLRVKSSCASVPTGASTGHSTNAAGNATSGNGTSEIDFADVTEQIAKLGLDYDNAITKINKLQETVNVYQSVCGIIKP